MPGATVPSGFRVYAIGDIHGRLDLLGRLHQMILEDAQGAALDARILVYLGDYVDRGPAVGRRHRPALATDLAGILPPSI